MVVAPRIATLAFLTLLWSGQSASAQSVVTSFSDPLIRFQLSDSITIPAITAARTPQGNTDRLREISLLIGIFGVALASSAVEEPSPLTCGPCDRADIPGFDRWAITGINETWGTISTVTFFVATGVAWADGFKRSEGSGFSHFRASLESIALTLAATDLLKQTAERRRPFTYQENLADLDADNLRDAKMSWPSGHASLASAVATSYWLSRGNEASKTVKGVVLGATLLTGLLRVPAGKHFPSDVLSGAALGIGSALLVHTIRF